MCYYFINIPHLEDHKYKNIKIILILLSSMILCCKELMIKFNYSHNMLKYIMIISNYYSWIFLDILGPLI